MKRFIAATLFALVGANATAQSDISPSFDIIGGLQLLNGSYTEIDLDINFGSYTLTT
jgi:hypothetical protein